MGSKAPQYSGSRGFSRSKLTNRSAVLSGVDGRTLWARRFRDLIGLHLSDLGGEAHASEAEKSLIRRAATLTVELERLEAGFATEGEADPEALDLYQRTAGNLRRLLKSTGLKRRPRDVTPDLRDYIGGRTIEGSAA